MARDLTVIGFDGVHLASIGLPLDLFGLIRSRVADQFRMRDDVGMHSRTRLLGQTPRPILTSDGRRVEVDDGFDDRARHLLIHVPDFDCPIGEWTERLEQLRAITDWLARRQAEGAFLSATGRGVWLLAAAGLLGDGPVPLGRSEIASFHARYPRIRVEATAPIVELPSVMLARGMAQEMTMTMRLVARLVSSAMAGFLAEAMGREESAQEGLSEDPMVAAAQIWLTTNASQKCRIATLARHLAVSQQTLIRHFRAELGITPRDYLRQQRVASAQIQLTETRRSIAQIATIVGYDDLKSFQKAFRIVTGMSASRYRTSDSRSAPSD